jgi:hypothetical protein
MTIMTDVSPTQEVTIGDTFVRVSVQGCQAAPNRWRMPSITTGKPH